MFTVCWCRIRIYVAGLHSSVSGSQPARISYLHSVGSTVDARTQGAAPISQALGILVPNYQFIIVSKLAGVSGANGPGLVSNHVQLQVCGGHSIVWTHTGSFSVRKRSREHGGVDSTSCQTVAMTPTVLGKSKGVLVIFLLRLFAESRGPLKTDPIPSHPIPSHPAVPSGPPLYCSHRTCKGS